MSVPSILRLNCHQDGSIKALYSADFAVPMGSIGLKTAQKAPSVEKSVNNLWKPLYKLWKTTDCLWITQMRHFSFRT